MSWSTMSVFGLGFEREEGVALGVGRRGGWGVPDADGDGDVDVRLEADQVKVVAVAGYHLLLCCVYGGFVGEVGFGVVDLDRAAAGGGGDAVFDGAVGVLKAPVVVGPAEQCPAAGGRSGRPRDTTRSPRK
ncbi:hypothetical protein [Streptomyces sp. SAS_270]|uniref:hypothetical protein n=1 Tax=Streptomyces sp. SAS_270 TaxID=3412748 RepID=UPI00403C0767